MTTFGISVPQTVEHGVFDRSGCRGVPAPRAEELGFDEPRRHATRPSVISPDLDTTRDAGLRRCVHQQDAPRLCGAGQHAAQPGAPGQEPGVARPVERRAARGRPRHRPGRRAVFSAFGVDPTSFVARFNEGVALMRALWTEDRVDHDGRFWQLAGAAMEPKPIQRTGTADLVRRRPPRRAPPVPSPTPTGSSEPARRRQRSSPSRSRSATRHVGQRRAVIRRPCASPRAVVRARGRRHRPRPSR